MGRKAGGEAAANLEVMPRAQAMRDAARCALTFALVLTLAMAGSAAAQVADERAPAPPDQPAAPTAPPQPQPPSPGVPGLAGEIPFETEALKRELEALKEQLARASDDKARARLTREREAITAALATLEQRAELERQLAALPEREALAKAEAERIAKALTEPLTLPDPFTEQTKIAAEDEERKLQKALLEANERLERATKQPEQLRAEIQDHKQELEKWRAELKRLQTEEATNNDPAQKRELRRRLAIVALTVERHEQQIANLKQWSELVQRMLPVLRLERDNIERAHKRAQERVQLYAKAWEDRLAAERARLAEQQRTAEILSREGLPFEQTRGEAEKQVLLEADRTKELQQRVTRWEKQLTELRTLVESEQSQSDALREALTKTTDGIEARTALLLTRLMRAVARERTHYDTQVEPARVQAEHELAQARQQLDALETERRRMGEAIDRMRVLARSLFEQLHKRYPEVYPEKKWEAEKARWIALEKQLVEQYAQRERALRTLIERLVEVIELAAREGQRIASLEAIVRKRSFWLREEPIIERRRIEPALKVLGRYAAAFREAATDPLSAFSRLQSWLGTDRHLLGLLVLIAWALVLRLGYRQAACLLAARTTLDGDAAAPIPLRKRLSRAGIRILHALLPGAAATLWTAAAHLWFVADFTLSLFLVSLLVTATRTAFVIARVTLRPFEPNWRLVRLPDDMAQLLYRLCLRAVFFTALYLALFAVAPLLGERATQALRPVLWLLYEYVLILLVLITLSSPVLSARLLGWFSPELAQRLRRFLVPLGLFVGGSVIAIFVLEAIGYRNAARSVMRSLLSSLVVITAGLIADRILLRVLTSRLTPKQEELGDAAAQTPADELTAQRRALVTDLIALVTDGVVLVGIVIGILFAFEVEPSTIESVLGTAIVAPADDGSGGIYLRNVLAAAVILFVTYLAHRYFREFISLYVLSRLGLSQGARFGITSVAGYVILGTGVVIAFGRLGIDLGKLEWLLAAAGVGIGFGLQEILSNFVSGLILLIERPIEVGDVVSIGELEGEIRKITIRATTVNTYDNVSVIVPNKDFITARVINWTHGDPKIRMRIPIGVAYGSNVALVRETLLAVAANYGRVLKRPAPMVSFRGFGTSSLDFELLVWIPTPALKRQVVSDLCSAIDAAFRRAGIEIPFPQVDLHVRQGDAMRVTLAGANEEAADEEEGAQTSDTDPTRDQAQIKKSIARQRAKRSRSELKTPRFDGAE